jgi:hypothetical protein
MAGGGLGGGDPMTDKRKLPPWMQTMGTPGPVPFQPQQIPGGQQMPGIPQGPQAMGAPMTPGIPPGLLEGSGAPLGIPQGVPQGAAGQWNAGQFNPASQDFGAYLQSIIGRGRRRDVR